MEIQKIKDYASKEWDWAKSNAVLSSSLSSIRQFKNVQQWTTDAKPIVHLLYFHSRVARIATPNPSMRSEILTLILLRPRSRWVCERWIRLRCLPDCFRQPRPLHHRLLPIYGLPRPLLTINGLRRAHASAWVRRWLHIGTLVHTVGAGSGSPSNHQARLVPSSGEARLASSGRSGEPWASIAIVVGLKSSLASWA